MASMKHLAGTAFLMLIVLYYSSSAMAGQTNFDIDVRELGQHPSGASATPKESFEIDLRELRRAPAGSSKPPHRDRRKDAAPAPAAVETAGREGTSSYTVKAGDFLFLILMREYGLSNAAAERLIPEVMRLNAIHTPRELTVGQRLTIPLPPPHPVALRTPRQPQPAAPPPPQAKPAPAPAERQVCIPAAHPCHLARAVVEQLGLAAAPIRPLPNESAFTAASADLKLVVACGLTPEEAYTYGRLLVFHHAQLLTFKGDEPPGRVIEELAERLGLSFRLADPAGGDTLPLSYIFPAEGATGRDVRLTILPAGGKEPPTSPVSPPRAPASSTRQ